MCSITQLRAQARREALSDAVLAIMDASAGPEEDDFLLRAQGRIRTLMDAPKEAEERPVKLP